MSLSSLPFVRPCLAPPLSLSPPPCPGVFWCDYECNSDAEFHLLYIIFGFSHDIYPLVFAHVTRESGIIVFQHFFVYMPFLNNWRL